MYFQTLNKKFKNGYKAFCEETSMHGFLELYRAKNYFWKIVWLFLITACFGVTGFQLYGSINQYIYQTAATSIHPANEDDIIYPSLKRCINHWLYWLNIPKALLTFKSKPTLLLILSRLSSIYVDNKFNISQAESDLIQMVKDQQKKTEKAFNYNNFFVNNAKNKEAYFGSKHYHKFLDKDKELVVIYDYINDIQNIYMCYTMNETTVRSLLVHEKFEWITFYDTDKDTWTPSFFTKNDFLNYFADSCKIIDPFNDCYGPLSKYQVDSTTKVADLFTPIMEMKRPHDLLIVDGFNKQYVLLAKPFRTYTIELRLTIQKWLPNGQKKCNPLVKSLLSNESCIEKCTALSYTYKDDLNAFPPCKKLATLILLEEEAVFENTCRNDGIISLETSDHIYEDHPLFETKGIQQEIAFQECMDNCSQGCEKWKWDMSVFASDFRDDSNNYNQIYDYGHVIIKYPTIENILVLKELESKTWEDFVANVGGLLGIWTGASILSLFQLIYLFCCSIDEASSNMIAVIKTKQNNIRTMRSADGMV